MRYESFLRNLTVSHMQMQAEMEDLIEGICSTYKDFSQKQADTASLLDCIAAEELQRGSAEMDPLPELEEGPDEVLLKLQYLDGFCFLCKRQPYRLQRGHHGI